MKRIPELDVLRAVAVLLMILDHAMYDLWGLLPGLFSDYPQELVTFSYGYWTWDVRTFVRFIVLFVFLGVSGICCSFSRSNLKRGLKLMGIALLLTLGTAVAGIIMGNPELMITFGVLHCIALSLILIGILEKFRCNKWIFLAIGLVMFGIGLWIALTPGYGKYVSYSSAPIWELLLKQIVGISKCGSDCFPWLLNGGQLFIGVFLGKQFYAQRKSLFKRATYSNNLITFLGRHSLIVYFAHQILLPVLLTVILVLCGYQLSFI